MPRPVPHLDRWRSTIFLGPCTCPVSVCRMTYSSHQLSSMRLRLDPTMNDSSTYHLFLYLPSRLQIPTNCQPWFQEIHHHHLLPTRLPARPSSCQCDLVSSPSPFQDVFPTTHQHSPT